MPVRLPCPHSDPRLHPFRKVRGRLLCQTFRPGFSIPPSVVEGALRYRGYQIDRLLYLLSDPQPTSISSVAYHGVSLHYDVDEKTSVLVRFSNGISFTFEVGWISNLGDISEGFSIFESKGAFRNERLFVEADQWEIDDQGNRRRYHEQLVEKPLEILDMPAQSRFENFIDACIEDKQPISCGRGWRQGDGDHD